MQSINILLQQPEERLGSQLEQLGHVMAYPFDHSSKVCFDFRNIRFVYPNWAVPLRAFMMHLESIGCEITLVNQEHLSYLSTNHFAAPLDPSNTPDFMPNLASFSHKNYLPILRLPTQAATIPLFVDKSLAMLTNVVCAQLGATGAMKSAISYFTSELCNNVIEHAGTSHIWIGAQHFPQKGFLDLCICDIGKGFLKSYTDHGRFPIHTHAEAMAKATAGLSTKDYEQNRGFGLATSRRLILEGLKGRMAVSSGNATRIDINPNVTKIIEQERFYWPGVLLNARLFPDNSIQIANYLE